MFRSLLTVSVLLSVGIADKINMNAIVDDYLYFLSKHDPTAFNEFSQSQLVPIEGSISYSSVNYTGVTFSLISPMTRVGEFIEDSVFGSTSDKLSYTGMFQYKGIQFNIESLTMPNNHLTNIGVSVSSLLVPLNLTITAIGEECHAHFTRNAKLMGGAVLIDEGSPFDGLDFTQFFNNTYLTPLNNHFHDIEFKADTCEPSGIIIEAMKQAIVQSGKKKHESLESKLDEIKHFFHL